MNTSERYEKKVQITRFKKVDFIPTGSNEPFKQCQLFYGILVEKDNEVGVKEVKITAPIETYDKLRGKKLPINCVIVFELDDLSKDGKPNIIDIKVVG